MKKQTSKISCNSHVTFYVVKRLIINLCTQIWLKKRIQVTGTVARHLSDKSVAVGDVRFLVLLLPIPEVQFNAAAPRQQDLPVHLQAGSTYVCMYLQLE